MREFAFLLLRLSGIPFLLRELFQRRRVSILCYHDPRPEDLEQHLSVLGRLYNFVALRQYLAWRAGRAALPAKPLVVTFDDGHRGNYRLREVLVRHGVTATIFVCSGIVGTNERFWWQGLPAGERERLKALPNAIRRDLIRRRDTGRTNDARERKALSCREVRELGSLIDFQSHTRFHSILPQCVRAEALDEIRGSKAELEQKFGLDVYAFAYPNGDYTARDIEIARSAGYACALTMDGGYNGKHTDAYRLRRIAMADRAGRSELIVKASGFWVVWERVAVRARTWHGDKQSVGARKSLANADSAAR